MSKSSSETSFLILSTGDFHVDLYLILPLCAIVWILVYGYPNLSWCGSAERCSGSSFGATLLVCRWSQRSGLSLARDGCAFWAWSVNLLQAWKGLSTTIEWNGLFPCPWVLIANSFWLEVGPTFPFQCCDPAWLEAVRSCECCCSPYGFICAAVLSGKTLFPWHPPSGLALTVFVTSSSVLDPQAWRGGVSLVMTSHSGPSTPKSLTVCTCAMGFNSPVRRNERLQ